MAKLKLQRARGTRDFSPEEKIIRQEVIDLLRGIFESFGYSPLETPLIERFEVLSSKYAGGAEILKETFKFKDQGKRELCLRYDLTVPFARFVGMNPNVKMPFKRYQMGRCFRDGPIKLGRYREFWQCDADVVGTKNMLADAELIMMAQRFFRELGFNVRIEVNNRKLLDGIMEQVKIPEKKRLGVIVALDKIKKIPEKDVKKELKDKGISAPQIKKLFEIMKVEGSNAERIVKLQNYVKNIQGKEGLDELFWIFKFLSAGSDQGNVSFEPTLARGLSYYTGPVFEVFISKPEKGDVTSSLAGGGRYDYMIGDFLGPSMDVPAVGISFGIEPVVEQLKIYRKEEISKLTVTQAYIIPIKTNEECLPILTTLRKEGIKADMDLVGRGISKNLDYANALNIPYVLIIGPQELAKKKVKLKDMVSGKEEMVSMSQVIKKLKM